MGIKAKNSFPNGILRTITWFLLVLGVSGPLLADSAEKDYYFSRADKLPAALAAMSAAGLKNGNVLVTGGYGKLFGYVPVVSNLACIYEYEKDTWHLLADGLKFPRLGHSSLVLDSGKVVIAGGMNAQRHNVPEVELFDPDTAKFSVIAKLHSYRTRLNLDLLPDRSVFISGKQKQCDILYPDSSSPTGFGLRPARNASTFKHSDHATCVLKDGSILLIGGRTTHLERFDPVEEGFHLYKSRLPLVYDDQAAETTFRGLVFIAGGQEVYSNCCTGRTWLFDPGGDKLTDGPPLYPTAHGTQQIGASDIVMLDLFPEDAALKGRWFFLCGGENDPGKGPEPDIILDSAWIYNAEHNKLTSVGPMLNGHDDFAAALLPAKNGYLRVLIIAGHAAGDKLQSRCEIFHISKKYLLDQLR